MRVLTEADVPASPIHTPDQVVKDPHVIFREMIQEISLPSGERIKQVGFPVKLSLTPGRVQTASPELGKDTDQILRSLGYSKKDIDGFRKDAVV